MIKSERMLVIMAHPDDAELWVGGTIALHAKFSDVYILVGTRDKIRGEEAKNGAKILGAKMLLETELTPQVCFNHIYMIKPHIVVTHRYNDTHFDHVNVFKMVSEAIIETSIKTGFPKKLYVGDTYNSLTVDGKVDGNIIVDISETFDLKILSLKCHISQPLEHFVSMATSLGTIWGNRIGKSKAEAFDSIPILGILPHRSFL